MNMEHWWKHMDRNILQYWKIQLSQCCCVNQKVSVFRTERKLEPPQWETVDTNCLKNSTVYHRGWNYQLYSGTCLTHIIGNWEHVHWNVVEWGETARVVGRIRRGSGTEKKKTNQLFSLWVTLNVNAPSWRWLNWNYMIHTVAKQDMPRRKWRL